MRPQDRREAALRQLECRIAARGRILAHGRSDERPRQGQVRHVVARGGQGYGPPAIEQHQTAVRLHDGNSLLLLYEDPSGTDVAQIGSSAVRFGIYEYFACLAPLARTG